MTTAVEARTRTTAVMKAQSTFSLKDHLFNEESVGRLATRLHAAWPAFPRDGFLEDVLAGFPQLELKARIAHMTSVLHALLPDDYPSALRILLDALPPELDPDRTDDDFGDFILATLSWYVATHGCTARHLRRSLTALRAMTKRFSAEDAIRTFLNAFPDRTLAFLEDCAGDAHYHVRRLASEGTRPLLPWAQRLTIDVRAPLPILDRLYTDRTRYITRSVANHVNDISKLDAALALETVARWMDSGRQEQREMDYIARHALRTLVRQGNGEALALAGFGAPAVQVIELATDTPRVHVGDAFRFSLKLRSERRQNLLVDYTMTFATAGGRTSRKVFRLRRLEALAGEVVALTKTHVLRPMTTRRLHAGEHRVTVQVNGRDAGTLAFDLVLE